MASTTSELEIAAVAFDLGGVLVDVDKAKLSEGLARPWPDVEDAFFGDGRHTAFSLGRIDEDTYLETVSDRLNAPLKRVRQAWVDMLRVRPGAADLVDACTVRVFAWSNTDPVHAEQLRPSLPAALFDAARTLSFEIGVEKPAPAFFTTALTRADVRADRVLYVDDRADNVESARALGVHAVVVDSLADVRSALVAHRVLSARA